MSEPTHDELLARLGELAREEDEALEADPRRKELLAPLGPEFRVELEKKLGVKPVDERPPAPVIPLWRRFAPAALGIAAAAAVALFVFGRGGESSVPEYAMTVTGGDKEVRSMHAPSLLKLSPGSRFEVLLRPAHPTKDIAVRSFLVKAGAAKPWEAPLEVSPAGAVRIAGETSKLFPGGPGEYGVLVLIGEPRRLDVDLPTAARIWDNGLTGAQVHRVQVTVVP